MVRHKEQNVYDAWRGNFVEGPGHCLQGEITCFKITFEYNMVKIGLMQECMLLLC